MDREREGRAMKQFFAPVVEAAWIAWAGVTGLAGSVRRHWALGAFSLVAAFGVWAMVEDVDNPRTEGDAPASGGIEVKAVNLPSNRAVEDLGSVRVRVEARKRDLASLRPTDFEAQVDLKDAGDATGDLGPRPVKVTAKRSGVRVVKVLQETVNIKLTEVVTREVAVTARVTTEAPAGFRTERLLKVEPPTVTVRGPEALVARIDTIDLDVNLSGAREQGDFGFEGDLVARSAGNTIAVSVTPARARATFEVKQVFSQRTIGLSPLITGSPAPGFVITNVTLDPPVVLVTGGKSIIEGLRGPLNIEKLDVTGARQNITMIKAIDRPPNVVTDRQSVVVKVEIQAIDCGVSTGSACESATFFVAPVLEGTLPAGLRVEGGYTVQVRVSGPLAQIAVLRPADLRATFTLTGVTPGSVVVTPKVTAPAGIRVESIEPMTVVVTSTGGIP
jgi:YbbR domain-containing protein